MREASVNYKMPSRHMDSNRQRMMILLNRSRHSLSVSYLWQEADLIPEEGTSNSFSLFFKHVGELLDWMATTPSPLVGPCFIVFDNLKKGLLVF